MLCKHIKAEYKNNIGKMKPQKKNFRLLLKRIMFQKEDNEDKRVFSVF